MKTLTSQETRRSVYATERMDFRDFSIQPGARMTISDNQNGVGAFGLRVIVGETPKVVRLESVEVR